LFDIKVLIVLVVTVLVVGGWAAVHARREFDAGADTRRELIRDTRAAVARGDRDELRHLGTTAFARAVDDDRVPLDEIDDAELAVGGDSNISKTILFVFCRDGRAIHSFSGYPRRPEILGFQVGSRRWYLDDPQDASGDRTPPTTDPADPPGATQDECDRVTLQ
jgi:hypothetical protein